MPVTIKALKNRKKTTALGILVDILSKDWRMLVAIFL